MPNRLRSIAVENYLGASSPAVQLDLDSGNALLIGPNNSGKSVLCGALQLFKVLAKDPLGEMEGAHFRANPRSDDRVAIDILHKGCDSAKISLTFDVDCVDNEIGRTLFALGVSRSTPRIDLCIDISIFSNGTKQLAKIQVGNNVVFEAGTSTPVAKYIVNSHGYAAEGGNSMLLKRLFELPRDISRTIVAFSAKRYLETSGGDPADIDALASGESLASWIRSANNPAANRPADRERHALLRAFEADFALFIDAKSVNVNSSDGGGINLTVDGELMPITRLGTGIGECLIILLVCKIAGQSKFMQGMSICALEEPELFLHPKLQRQLIDFIQSYGVQLITTTHSPTVLDFGWRAGWKIFSTRFDRENRKITVDAVPRNGVGAVLMEIGVRPSDWLQADGILFVEGPTDIPVFKKWISICPNYAGRNIAVIALGGTTTANGNFDFSELNKLGRSVAVIMDSERTTVDAKISPAREKVLAKCEAAGIPCTLTARAATENYFSAGSLKAVYGDGAVLGHYEKPIGIKKFSKDRNGEVAAHMQWSDIEASDIGNAISAFIGRLG